MNTKNFLDQIAYLCGKIYRNPVIAFTRRLYFCMKIISYILKYSRVELYIYGNTLVKVLGHLFFTLQGINRCAALFVDRYMRRKTWWRDWIAPSPTPWCSSYRKGSLWVTLDNGCQLYLLQYSRTNRSSTTIYSFQCGKKTWSNTFNVYIYIYNGAWYPLLNTQHYKVRIKSKVE